MISLSYWLLKTTNEITKTLCPKGKPLVAWNALLNPYLATTAAPILGNFKKQK